MAESVTSVLRRALRLVEERRADAYREMAASLEGLTVSVSVEDSVWFRGVGGRVVEETGSGRAAIRMRTGRAAMVAVLAGRATLTASLRSGAIELAGSVDALRQGLRAFEYFVGALLRIDEAEGLRDALEGD